MATEIAILNIRMPERTLPQPDQDVAFMTWTLGSDDVTRMIGDGWQPLSHQVLPAPVDGVMLSLLCVRAERSGPLDLPEV